MANQEFKTPQEALVHFGKKGMKWGVINEERPSGSRSRGAPDVPEINLDAYSSAMRSFYSKKTSAELHAEGQAKLNAQAEMSVPFKGRRQVKRNDKADKLSEQADRMGELASELEVKRDALGPGVGNRLRRMPMNADIKTYRNLEADLSKQAGQVREGKLTDRQKMLLAIGGAAAVGGLAIYGANKYADVKAGYTSDVKKQMYEDNKDKTSEQWKQMFGSEHGGTSASNFMVAAEGDFYGGLINQKAMKRPDFTIPKGTIFQRLSNHEEDSSRYGTSEPVYSTFLHNDKKIYGSSFEFGAKKHTVNFEAKHDVKVPALSTVLSHLSMIKQRDFPGETHTPESIFSEYHTMTGGGWKNKTSFKLFESLKSSGYSAIVDDMDAGYLGDLPVVFFGDAAPATSRPRGTSDMQADGHGLMKLSGIYA